MTPISKTKHSTIGLLTLSVCILALIGVTQITQQKAGAQVFDGTSTSGNMMGFAWSGINDDVESELEGGSGWLSFNCENDGFGCGTATYGVTVNLDENSNDFGDLDGYAWSTTLGWLSFVDSNSSVCGSPAAFIDVADASGGEAPIKGWARFTVAGNDPYWDGCVKFDNGSLGEVTVDMQSGQVSGSAWGSNLVSWLSFDCPGCNVFITTDDIIVPEIAQVTIGANPEIVSLNITTQTDIFWNEVGLNQPVTSCEISVTPGNLGIINQQLATAGVNSNFTLLASNNDDDSDTGAFAGGMTITDLDDVYDQGVNTLTFTISGCMDENGDEVPSDSVTIILTEDIGGTSAVNVTTTLLSEDPVAQTAQIDIDWQVINVQDGSCTTNTLGNNNQDSTPPWETILNGNPNSEDDSGSLNNVQISCSASFQMTCTAADGSTISDFDGESVSWCGPAPTPGGTIPSYIEI